MAALTQIPPDLQMLFHESPSVISSLVNHGVHPAAPSECNVLSFSHSANRPLNNSCASTVLSTIPATQLSLLDLTGDGMLFPEATVCHCSDAVYFFSACGMSFYARVKSLSASIPVAVSSAPGILLRQPASFASTRPNQ